VRRQLREFRPPADEAGWYAERYPHGYQHDTWPDHRIRVRATVGLATVALAGHVPLAVVADLSCGDAAIPAVLAAQVGASLLVLGDALGVRRTSPLVPSVTVPGSLPGSLAMLGQASVYVCSETLEHLADPDGLLIQLRPHARFLVASTPVGAHDDDNPEHYWAWDIPDVTGMLAKAGWAPLLVATVDPRAVYTFGIWVCE
jgi:hypothetical protein